MTQPQQGDPILYQSLDDGELEIIDGVVTMDGGLQTTVYISLFGGNFKDDGLADNVFSWWGNQLETESINKLISETQNLLQTLIATSANLPLIEQAANRDLAWMITVKAANEITVEASIPALNTIKIIVTINAIGLESRFEFVQNWRASA